MSLAASEIQIFFQMGCKMNDSSDTLPAMARRMKPTVSGEMLTLHNLLTFGNTQTSLASHSLNRRFLGLYTERGDQRCELLDINHNQNRFAILLPTLR